MHSVLNEVDFCDEWTALDRAFHLAFEIYPPDLNIFRVAPIDSLSNFEHMHRDNAVGTVRFKDEVELFIGLDEDLTFERICIPAQSLTMAHKPWSLLPCLDIESRVPNHCVGMHSGHSCEVHDFPFVLCSNEPTCQPRSEPFSDIGCMISLGEFSNCSYVHASKPGCQISFDEVSIDF